ncbi:MAG: hypothetical protein AABN33_12550 [Acidobacteriota bacterium]
MPTQLKIVWEGSAPGLAEHRLSLGAFGVPLTLLLAAVRRIASNTVSMAVDEKVTGRFADPARQLDVQIDKLVEGSSGFEGVCTFDPTPGTNALLFFRDLVEQTTITLLDALEAESKGQLRHSFVRKYLRSLPPGVARQTYTLHDNGREIHRPVVIEDMMLQDLPDDLPYLKELTGNIIGVGFEPGRTEVRIKSEAEQISLAATAGQVENALDLRHSEVQALAVIGRQPRLLRLQPPNSLAINVTPEYIEQHIFKRWDALLRRLAE